MRVGLFGRVFSDSSSLDPAGSSRKKVVLRRGEKKNGSGCKLYITI